MAMINDPKNLPLLGDRVKSITLDETLGTVAEIEFDSGAKVTAHVRIKEEKEKQQDEDEWLQQKARAAEQNEVPIPENPRFSINSAIDGKVYPLSLSQIKFLKEFANTPSPEEALDRFVQACSMVWEPSPQALLEEMFPGGMPKRRGK